MKALASLLLFGAMGRLWPATALAQPTGPVDARRDAHADPAPILEQRPRRSRSAPYRHDGFYARFATGPGLFLAKSGNGADGRHFSGGAVAFEGAIAGSPVPGFALGGGVMTNPLFAVTSRDDIADGDEPNLDDVTFRLDAVGMLFVDIYPRPSGGFHFQGFFGFGTLATNRDADDPWGWVVAPGAGYEWFVDEQMSLGVLARVVIAPFEVSELGFGSSSGTSVSSYLPALLVTATIH